MPKQKPVRLDHDISAAGRHDRDVIQTRAPRTPVKHKDVRKLVSKRALTVKQVRKTRSTCTLAKPGKPREAHSLADNNTGKSCVLSRKDGMLSKATDACEGNKDVVHTCAQHVRDIKVMTYFNCTPWVSGCVKLSDDILVLADYNNHQIKLLNTTHHTLVTQLKLSGKPWDIIRTGESQVAVTCPGENTISFVNVGNTLQLERTIEVKGSCRGIRTFNENLLVSYDDPLKLQVVSKTGHAVHTIVGEQQDGQLFDRPRYIFVGHGGNTIYISDWERNTVTNVDITGTVIATYKHEELRGPLGLTAGRTGEVFVCGFWTDTIHRLTSDLTQGHVILRQSDGIVRPSSIFYCEDTEMLYVGMRSNAVVKVYQLK